MGKRTHGPYLIAAIEYGDIEKVSHILSTKFRDKAKVKIFLTSEVRRLASEYVEVPLLLSATIGDPTIIKYFITTHSTNVNFVYEYGPPTQRRRKTALLIAVRRGNYATVDALLGMHADANFADHKQRTALHHAVRRADYRMAKLLLARGALTSPCDMAGNTPLHVASIFGHLELCRLLLRHGGDLYKKGQLGALPIHIAAREGHAALVKMFVTLYEVNVDIRVPCYGDREQCPIHVAASQGHHETVFTLLEQCGADVNIVDSECESPLHCAVVNEYDPLGMKSKDDYTETAKILLNFGAEANVRNARGETPLHLAARNEFQKVVEILILAGCDPSVEDNDKNKAIDLVSEDDAVSKQTLKNAMADRDRLLLEARDVRAKGFQTSLQRELPLSMRSQSTMNVPLLAGMHSAAAAGRYTSHTALFQPNMSMPYPAPSLSGGPHNLSMGYIPGAVGMATHYAGGGGGVVGSTESSSGGSWGQQQQQQFHQPRLPDSMMIGARSAVHLDQHASRMPPPAAALRKARSVEELDQPSKKSGKSGPKGRRRVRKGSYQESEASSFWAVTPPGSGHDDNELDADVPPVKGRKNTAMPSAAAATPDGGKKKTKTPTKSKHRLSEQDEEQENKADVKAKATPQPLQFMSVKAAALKAAAGDDMSLDGNENDDYFLDDDSSVDMLELDDEKPRKKKPVKKTKAKDPQPVPAVRPPGKGEPVVKKKAVESWLDEQARILKERNRTEKAPGPTAHSTPPPSKKNKKNDAKEKKQLKKKKSKDDESSDESSSSESSTSSSSSSDSETSDTDSDNGSAPVGPPPPPPTKMKPDPPPKPSAKGDGGKSSGTAPQRKPGGPGRQQPLFQMEEPNIERIIQMNVDESTVTGETVISIIPIQPPGPTRVTKIAGGAEASTYVNLSRSGTPQLADDGTSKSKKSSTPTPEVVKPSKGGGKVDDGKKAVAKDPVASGSARPVPKPRESKKPEANPVKERKLSDPSSTKKKSKKNRKSTQDDSDKSTDFSDEDHEEAAALAALKSSSRSTPTLTNIQSTSTVADRAKLFSKPLPPAKTAHRPPGTAGRLVFQRADDAADGSVDKSATSSANLRISFGDVSTSSTTGALATGSGQQQANASVTPIAATAATTTNTTATTSKSDLTTSTSGTGSGQQPQAPKPRARQQQPSAVTNHRGKQSSSSSSWKDSSDDGESDEASDDGNDETLRADDFRTVSYSCGGDDPSLGFTIVGGNVKGVFVDAVDAGSVPARAGLRAGDQLLVVNGRIVSGRTRDEVEHMVRPPVGAPMKMTLLVRYKPNLTRSVAEADQGAGDSFYVKAHFSYDPAKRGELTVSAGDVFLVNDTLPDGSAGFWRAKKVDRSDRQSGGSDAIGNGSTSAEGLIPNRVKADQILICQNLTSGKSNQHGSQRGAAFFRSFRRSKSVGRGAAGQDDDENSDSMGNVPEVTSYERVIQKVAEVRRPVVILGLFCDTVRGMLAQEGSGTFVLPEGDVETKDSSGNIQVDVSPIAAVPPNQHCLLILKPPTIEHLQQKTDLNPIVIYISPVSKDIVKLVKAKLAPTYNKNPGYMYDEAARFERNYEQLFSAVVPFTTDDSWYRHLHDAIDYLQNLPSWVRVPPEELNAAAEAEAAKVLPPKLLRSLKAAASSTVGVVMRTTDRSLTGSGAVRPVSRSTDDLPTEYRTRQSIGGTAELTGTGSNPAAEKSKAAVAKQKSTDAVTRSDGLNGKTSKHTDDSADEETGSRGGTLKSTGGSLPGNARTGSGNVSGTASRPAGVTSAVPGGSKARTQSSSSTLDQKPTGNPGTARRFIPAATVSHETQL